MVLLFQRQLGPPVPTYNIMNTKLKLVLVFLGGVLTTLLIEYLFKEYFWAILTYLIFGNSVIVK